MSFTALLCSDGSELAHHALVAGLAVVAAPDRVVIATVIDLADPTLVVGTGMAGGVMTPIEAARDHEETMAAARAELEAIRTAVGLEGAETELLAGAAGPAICDFAATLPASVVIIGTSGRSGLKRAVLGSVSDYVVRNAPVPGRHDAAGVTMPSPTILPLCLGWMSNDAGVLVSGASGPMRSPIPGYLVVHERGAVLFDTGLHDTLMSSTDELGGLARVFTVELAPVDLVDAQLTARGIDVGEVTHVVDSHLHFDHCGRNGPFADAATLVQRDEWEAAQHTGPTTYVGVPLDEVGAGRLELLDGAHDVFGDGTVVCVPTPGHTVGHQSLLVRRSDDEDAASALLVGDACYLRSMLVDGVLPPFHHDADRQRDSYRLLARYEAEGTRLLFSHDVEHWDRVPEALAAAPS